MATYINISGAKLYLNDEFALPVCFEPGETKTGLSNYMERYTSAYQSGVDIVLRRVGAMDGTVLDGADVPVPVVEEENMAVRPSRGNRATQGVYWGDPGKANAAVSAGYNDLANDATRLKRVGFNTEQDISARQIDTRYLSVKPDLLIAVNGTQVETAQVVDPTGTITLDTVSSVIKVNGRRATAADCANAVYGSLLTEGTYYTAFGSIVCYEDGVGTETIGFRLIGINDEAFTAFTTLGWTALTMVVASANTITLTITGGGAADTITPTVYFAQHINTAARADAFYGVADQLRGWYEIAGNTTTAAKSGMMYLGENGALHILDAVAIAYVAWS